LKILLLDNFDSFTYNLHHLLTSIDGVEADVFRNDEITVGDAALYDRIVISPGPGIPSGAGITMQLISENLYVKPVLGICLGMQALAEVCGGKIFNLEKVMHGVAVPTMITDDEEKLFSGISSPFLTGRYHSWAVERNNLPEDLLITAIDPDGIIMGLTHKNNLLRGVQFHPESILTENGLLMMKNWVGRC
jgi:anthranilate synthase component 2